MEAIHKLRKLLNKDNQIVPQKIIFRQKLVEQLKEAGIREAQGIKDEENQSHIQ